ncbi:unnamed protein product, partial [Closterium sp. NIES-54]
LDGMAKDVFDYGVVLFELLMGLSGLFLTRSSSHPTCHHPFSPPGPDGMAKDAFDYGVVLFELLTGRRGALVADREGADGLIAWAEPRIEEYELSAACAEPTKRMVVRMLDVLAKECVQEDPRCRPTMKDLVVRLYSLQESLASQ